MNPLRVIHLLSPRDAGDEGVLACAMAMREPGADHSCVVLGDDRDEQHAWSMGIDSVDRVSTLGIGRVGASMAARRLRSVLRARLDGETRPVVVNAWSVGTLDLLRGAMGKRAVLRSAVLPHLPPGVSTSRRHAFGMDEARLVVFSERDRLRIARAASARRGGRLNQSDIRLAPAPVFDRQTLPRTDRVELRRLLGVSPSERIIGLLADPPAMGDAQVLAFQLGLCHTMGRQFTGIFRRGGRHARLGVEFTREHRRIWQVLPVDLSLPELVAVSDVCVAQLTPDGPSCGTTALSLCASMSVPVAAAPSVHAAHRVVSVHDVPAPALLAATDDPYELSLPILRLVEDAQARDELARAQRAWCDHRRGEEHFASMLVRLWHEMANVPIHRRELPTPGMLVELKS